MHIFISAYMYVYVCLYANIDTNMYTYVFTAKFFIRLHTLTSLLCFPCLYTFPQILLPMLCLLFITWERKMS